MIKIDCMCNEKMSLEIDGDIMDVMNEFLNIVAEFHKEIASGKDAASVVWAKTFECTLCDEDYWKMVNQKTVAELMESNDDGE